MYAPAVASTIPNHGGRTSAAPDSARDTGLRICMHPPLPARLPTTAGECLQFLVHDGGLPNKSDFYAAQPRVAGNKSGERQPAVARKRICNGDSRCP